MTDTQDAERRPESPLGRFLGVKYTYDRDEQGRMTVTEQPYVSNMPRKGKPKHHEFWESRKNLNYVRRFMNSRGTSEWAGLGAMLEVAAQTIPPRVVLPDHVGDFGSLNGIVGLCDASGGGKTNAQKLGQRVLDMPGFEIQTRVVATGEGIPTHYGHYNTKAKCVEYHTDAFLQIASDVDGLYAQMTRTGATLLPAMLSAWDGGNLGGAIATKEKMVPVGQHRYRWGLIVGVQLLRSQRLLETESSGLLQRILLLPTDFRDRVDRSQEKMKPLAFAPPVGDAGDAVSEYLDLQNMGKDLPPDDMHVLTLPECVLYDTDEFDLKKRQGRMPDPADHHLNLVRLKLAARFMWFEGRAEMNEEDWQLAGYVIDRIHKPTRERLRQGAKESRRRAIEERELDRALVRDSVDIRTSRVADLAQRMNDAMGDGEMTGGELQRKYKQAERDDAIQSLVNAGIWVKTPTGTNRGGWRYSRAQS